MHSWLTRFAAIWTGQTLSNIGLVAGRFALIWWVTQETGSATAMVPRTPGSDSGVRSCLLTSAGSVASTRPVPRLWRDPFLQLRRTSIGPSFGDAKT